MALSGGRIVKEQSGFFWVELDSGGVVVCRLRGRLLEAAQGSDVAALGDRVWVEPPIDGVGMTAAIEAIGLEGATGSIERVEPRVGVISRSVRTDGVRGAGGPEREQVIIANVDQAFFVFAAAAPDPKPSLLDRFLVVGEKAGIPAVTIIINKIDLDSDKAQRIAAIYAPLGYAVLFTSAVDGVGVDRLRDRLAGKITVFTGPSGVGKTSLLNEIQPGLGRAVKAVSASSALGMHTTRDSILVKLANGGYVADTPGIRQLQLWDIEPEELDGYFREIAARVGECRFTNCQHRMEPGCAVREAVETGAIARSRYSSYLHLREALEAAYVIE